MQYKKTQVVDLLRIYSESDKDYLELEIRFTIVNFDIWKSIYQKIIKSEGDVYKFESGKIEQSITVSVDEDRKEIYFENGVKTQEKYIKKHQLSWIKVETENLSYRISLASEKKIAEFSIARATEIRLRLRSSIFLENFNWRIDFTYVKSMDSSQFQKVGEYRDKLFDKNRIIKYSDFITYVEKIKKDVIFGIENDPQITYEIELEYIGKKASEDDLIEAIKFIGDLMDNKQYSNYHHKLYEVAKLILKDQDDAIKDNPKISDAYKSKFVLKQLANQPVNFNYEEYLKNIIPNIDQFYLSDKANGDRCFVYISNNEVVILTSNNCINIAKILKEPKSKFNFDYFKGNTILDAEIVELDLEKETFDKIYVFDILYLNNEKLTQNKMEDRESKLIKACLHTGIYIQQKILVRLSSNGDPDSDFRKQISKVYNRKSRQYPIDGLTFTPNFTKSDTVKYIISENYFDMLVYKWKSPEQMTIDFMVMKAPKKLIGIKPYLPKDGYEIYFLFCGIKYSIFKMLNLNYIPEYKLIFSDYRFTDNYFPIQFSPSLNPNAYIYYHPIDFKLDGKLITEQDLHGHVVEFKYDCLTKEAIEKKDCHWIIDKLRTDRDIGIEKNIGYGNDFKTAESTYDSYQNPLTLDMLINPKIGGVDSYFAVEKANMYKPLTKFNNFVKAQMIRQLENSEWIIDLASGKGQDLFVYNGFGVKNGIFIDIDKDALTELNRRKYELDKKEFYVYTMKPRNNLTVYSKNLDLREDCKKISSELYDDFPLPKKGADGVVMNLALHYIISNDESLNNFVSLVDSLLKPGGIFIFTCFDGNKIAKLLKNIEYEKSWDLYEDKILKYSIKKLYQDDSVEKKISVIHPFSNGKYYEENLLDINRVLEKFKDIGFILQQNGSFGDWTQKFKYFNNYFYSNLSKNDIYYSSLYQYVSLFKPVS